MMVIEKINALKTLLKKLEVDAFIVASNDAFFGEYIPDAAKRLEWLTSFTGSAGTAVVTQDNCAFFTDGRYILQAQAEIGDAWEHHNIKTLKPLDWIISTLSAQQVLAFDPMLHSVNQIKQLEKACQSHDITIKSIKNPIDILWQDRPDEPATEIVDYPVEYAGLSRQKKCQMMSNVLQQNGCDAWLITLPESLCWLLNIRGNDLPYTPFVLGYGLLHVDGKVDLFVEDRQCDTALKSDLNTIVTFCSPAMLEDKLETCKGKKIWLDPNLSAYHFYYILNNLGASVYLAGDPCLLPKACKNEVEQEGVRDTHVIDGVAVTCCLAWLNKAVEAGEPLTEMSVVKKLEKFRSKDARYLGASFPTISGFNAHGAIVHYRVTEASNIALEPPGVYLVDSGGQYYKGTTDITRTVAIGKAPDEAIYYNTLVLKGHIALASAIFPYGTTGSQLDSLARHYLWQAGVDYDHGTGHGVGTYLNVHEGPQRISSVASQVALDVGMVVSNEPGYYQENAFGIRIENLLLVIEKQDFSKNNKKYLGFETLTKVPLDPMLIDFSLLTKDELYWLRDYHQLIKTQLSPSLDRDTNLWLERQCKAFEFFSAH